MIDYHMGEEVELVQLDSKDTHTCSFRSPGGRAKATTSLVLANNRQNYVYREKLISVHKFPCKREKEAFEKRTFFGKQRFKLYVRTFMQTIEIKIV
jgi:hypothetical protein